MREISHEKRILDVGGGARFQKWLAPYEAWFSNAEYRTLDYDGRTGADVVGDIHALPIGDEEFDGIICSSVLEHVRNPRQAVREMRRVLRTGGKAYVYVPSIYPYHARPNAYPDYWRFFDDTLKDLFSDFSSVEIVKVGGYAYALSFFAPMQHRLRWLLTPLARAIDRVIGERTTTSGYMLYAIK